MVSKRSITTETAVDSVNVSYYCSFMGRGIIDRPLREVAEYIRNVQNNMTWDNFLIVCTCMTLYFTEILVTPFSNYISKP